MLARNGSGAAAVGTAGPQEMCEPASPHRLHTEIPCHLEAVRLFYELAMPRLGVDQWLQASGVDMRAALLLAGPICELPIIRYAALRSFQLGEENEPLAVPAMVHVVTGGDAETPIGLVAWRRERPDDVLTYPAGLPALGLDQLDNPASYFGGSALPVHRTPLRWLARGCRGIVPLDLNALWAVLDARRESYALAAESIEHGHALRAGLQPLPPGVRIVVPHRETAA
jgi:hypothetical protein